MECAKRFVHLLVKLTITIEWMVDDPGAGAELWPSAGTGAEVDGLKRFEG